MEITPGGQALGARITGIDLAQPLSDGDFRSILRALGEHGVLCFPDQTLDADRLSAFGARICSLSCLPVARASAPRAVREPSIHERRPGCDCHVTLVILPRAFGITFCKIGWDRDRIGLHLRN